MEKDIKSTSGDVILLIASIVFAILMFGIGYSSPLSSLSLIVGIPLLLGSFGVFFAFRGTTLSSYLMPILVSLFVIMHIQLGQGNLTYHFGVFTTLALVMVYQNWKVVAMTAGIFAVHHIAFDRLQAMGFGLYCLTEPDFLLVLLHAKYVVLQTGLEIFMVIKMKELSMQGQELVQIVSQLTKFENKVNLKVSEIKTKTEVASKLKDVLSKLNESVTNIESSVHQLRTASEEIVSGNMNLSSRTEQQASNLEETASSMEEFAATTKSNADSAKTASGEVENTVKISKEGSKIVGNVIETMSEINSSSQKIVDIISTIDSIAFQTNILALNAAVEAARAGEQGKGFAVVASEVRNLAGRSATAAKEIKTLIESSSTNVEKGTELVNLAGQNMTKMEKAIDNVNILVNSIARASLEQSEGIAQINKAIATLDSMTQQNAALVEESTASTSSLKEQAQKLDEIAETFRV